MATHNEVVDRVAHLYEYLAALSLELSRAPIRVLSGYQQPQIDPTDLPVHPSVRLAATMQSGDWLTVKRVPEPDACSVPLSLQALLADTVTANPDQEPELPIDLLSADDLEPGEADQLTQAFEVWLSGSWRPWAERARRILQSRHLYKTLYDLRLLLQRDQATHEIVWGFGVLNWRHSGTPIQHPVLIAPVRLDLNPDDGTITVKMEAPPQLEPDFLQGLDLPALVDLVAVREVLRDSPPDPWVPGGLSNVYAQIVAPLGVDATVADSDADREITEQPTLVPTWRIFVRKRPVRFQRFYTDLRAAIRESELVPPPVAAVVAAEAELDSVFEPDRGTREQESGDYRPTRGWEAAASRLLMPLPTNDEQERIARQLASRRGVTVQGPPGTGKSHTIANLICHLVAHGKRVLVTAQNEQALSVLRDKIPAELRDYSISVLGNSQSAIGELRASVQTIMSVVADVEIGREQLRVDQLAVELDTARESARKLELLLLELLRTESAEFRLPTGTAKAAKVASWLSDREAELARIPDALAVETTLPLSDAELHELFELASRLDPDDAVAAVRMLPRVADLPTAADLMSAHIALDDLRDELADVEGAITSWEAIDSLGSLGFTSLLAEVEAAESQLELILGGWHAEVLAQVRSGDQLNTLWLQQYNALEVAATHCAELGRSLLGHRVEIPLGDHRLQQAWLNELSDRFKAGKGIPKVTRRELREFHAQVTVNGLEMRTEQEVLLASLSLRQQQARAALGRLWQDLRDRVAAPDLVEGDVGFPHEVAAQLATLRVALHWHNQGESALRERLAQVVKKVPDALRPEDLAALRQLLASAAKHAAEQEQSARLRKLQSDLGTGVRAKNTSRLWSRLDLALKARDWPAWTAAYTEIERLTELRPLAERRDELCAKLSAVSPRWAAMIVNTRGDVQRCGDPARVSEMWLWRQAETWLRHILDQGDAQDLQLRIEGAHAEVRRIVLDLCAKSARISVKQNLKESQRQALVAWLTALGKIGKGTGKYAPMWQAEARRMMPNAMGAVPVWIMPIHRVLESFDPLTTEPFDVVIVDESSQCDVLTVGILGLGAKAVIVGDDRQISPAAVGVDQSSVFRLIRTHLPDLPNAMLLDAQASLYDTASRVYPGTVLLKEHFRSVPDIISFSNRFYDNQILPLRESVQEGIGQALRLVHVADGARSIGQYGDANQAEAEALVEQVAECIGDAAYEGMSMGVISLLQGGQTRLIEQLLLERIGAEELEKRKLRVGDPYNFQGDERDVVFISVVADDNRSAATKRADEQRINVAASRARDQLWVFHTVDAQTLHDDDVRGQLIRYVRDHDKIEQQVIDMSQLCESEFERSVLRALLERGYKVTPQVQVGKFRIDLVVQGFDDRLAIECDGEAFHGADRVDDDLRRQRILQRLGWKFWRVRGAAYFRDPDAALATLWERLAELGILPDAARPESRIAPQRRRVEEMLDDSLSGSRAASQFAVPVRAEHTAASEGASAQIPPLLEQPEGDSPAPVPVVSRGVEPPTIGLDQPRSSLAASKERSPASRTPKRLAGPKSGTESPHSGESITKTARGGTAHGDYVPVTPGYTLVGWIRPHEAEAAVKAYETEVTVRGDLAPFGIFDAKFYPSGHPLVLQYGANVSVVRYRPAGPKIVCWVRREEAEALLRAVGEQRTIEFRDAQGRVGRVEYFAPESFEAATYRSVVRLLRKK